MLRFLPLAALLLLACARKDPNPYEPVQPDADTDTDSDSDSDTERTEMGPTVLLISIDGFAQDYWGRMSLPNLERIAREGARAEHLESVYPSLTFPNHYSQVTGLYPEAHGIISNSFTDPVTGKSFTMSTTDPDFWLGEPIWITAEKQGVTTATMFWPGSEVLFENKWRPTHWLQYDGSMPYTDRVDKVLEWLDEPVAVRPQFLTMYFSSVDHAGHDYGPDSWRVNDALADVDGHIGDLLSGLQERSLLDAVDIVVVSDHGMQQLSRDRVEFLDDYIDLSKVWVSAWSQHVAIDPRGQQASVLQGLQGLQHASCHAKADLPERLHYSDSARIPEIICLPDAGWVLNSRSYFDGSPGAFTGATHGWDPTYQAMHAVFMARGPHIRAGHTQPAFNQVQLYNLFAHILEIEPAPNAGDPALIADMLVEP